jgi:hypothetical protein
MPMTIKRHDLEPPLVLTVSDGSGVSDLRNVASWRVIGSLNGVVVVDSVLSGGNVVINGATPATAVLTRAWVAGDTATTGDMKIEVEASWPTGRPQTFPADGSEVVHILPDLG